MQRKPEKDNGLGGIQLGSVAGIDILIHWSWFIVFGLLTWSLGDRLFPDDWSAALRWSAAALTTVLFFGSILLHEVAHAVAARRQGISVRSITLLIFGGATALESEPESAKQDLLIGVAGPVTSLLVGVAFGILALALSAVDAATVPAYLAFINIVLGIFNLIPALPLDGGRVFRAIVWARKGSLQQAARVASLVGSVFGVGLMAAGAAVMVAGELFSGIWLLVIGWFLRSQAEAAYRHTIAKASASGSTEERRKAA